MRVEIVSDTFIPDINGVAMTLGRLMDGLRMRGHLVHVIRAGDTEGVENQSSAKSVRMPGYKEVRIGLPSPLRLRKRWRKKRPDAVYVATESPLGFSALKAANSLGIPVVCGFHTNFHEYLEQYRLGGLQNAALTWLRSVHSLADRTLTPSVDVMKMLKAHDFQNVELLGRGVDTKLFHSDRRDSVLRSQWGASNHSPVAIMVGRVAPEKNFELALRCFKAMRERVPDMQCVIVGDGPIRGKLEKEYPWVHFTGAQRGGDLARHYASADILLFPSETETFGNVLLEGMASGLITVSYDYAASALHVRENDNGLKAKKSDEEAFLKLAQVALDLRGFAGMRERALRSVSELGWDAVVDRFENTLLSLVKERPSENVTRRRKKGKLQFRSLFISDVHLGLPESKVHELTDFLKHSQCENLYLNGDIIDGWALKRGEVWTKRHTRVIRTVLKKMEKEQMNVWYIRGNHDDILDRVLPFTFGSLKLVKEVIHTGLDGKQYLVVHGDGFDSVSTNHRWIALVGAFAYDSLLKVNRIYNAYRAWRGKEYFSISKKLKGKVKSAVSFIDRYEEQLQKLAHKKGCDGVICGHIHTPEDKLVDDLRYLNSGDWVESLSCVVENLDGTLEVIDYSEFLARLGEFEKGQNILNERVISNEDLTRAARETQREKALSR